MQIYLNPFGLGLLSESPVEPRLEPTKHGLVSVKQWGMR